MEDSDTVRDLMAKLMEAVEASLSGSTAVRDALAELVRNGYEARLFFVANAETADEADEDGAETEAAASGEDDEEPEVSFVMREIGSVIDDGKPDLELTKLDRDFLKSLNIKPETD
jgi:hypothetical protein